MSGAGAVAANGWQCAFCIFTNDSITNVCGICGQRKRPTIDEVEFWHCFYCSFKNTANSNICVICHVPRPVNVGGYWECGVCTLANEPNLKNCSACGYAKPQSSLLHEKHEEPLPFSARNQIIKHTNTRTKTENNLITHMYQAEILGAQPLYAIYPQAGENYHLTENSERFECVLCSQNCEIGDGIVLRNCYHTFCKHCLKNAILYSAEMEIKCPFKDEQFICPSVIQDREINALLNYDGGKKNQTANNFTGCGKANCRNCAAHGVDANSFCCDLNINQEGNGISNWRIRSPPRPQIDYQELIDLERRGLITNTEHFDCTICFVEHGPGEGVVIRDCLHTFCKDCLKQAIKCNEEAVMKCPFGDGKSRCESTLQDREIKALVDAEVFEKYLNKSIKEAESKIKNTFHCKTVDCVGWCIYEEDVTNFYCPVCRKTNCINCKVIHTGLDCKQYQEKVKRETECNSENAKTKNMLEEMVKAGKAMACPTCQIILSKISGCDWLRCSMCKTEICWVTRGPRWGPKGIGDTSGGCRCHVNNKPCHPRCGNCH